VIIKDQIRTVGASGIRVTQANGEPAGLDPWKCDIAKVNKDFKKLLRRWTK
jgi:hypothetical protein